MKTARRLLAAALTFAAVGVVPSTPAAAATGHYTADATSHLVHVNAVNLGAAMNGLADLTVGPATSAVDSNGLGGAAERSTARAANLDLSLAGGAAALEGLLVEAIQSAPPAAGEPVVEQLLEVPAAPVAEIDVATASAYATWAGDDKCVAAGDPITTSTAAVADAQVLLGTPLGNAAVALHNADAATVDSSTRVSLVDVPTQAGRAVKVDATTQLTGITLFEGSANQIGVNVIGQPALSVLATGDPATSTAEYTEPILQIVDAAGEALAELDATAANVTLELPPGGTPALLLRLQLGTLDSTIGAGGVTAASNLLHVTVLDITGTLTLLDLSIAGATASAKVPAGGVKCAPAGPQDPLRDVQVDASTGTVPSTGGEFQYLIAVPNRGPCTLTNVKVVSTVTGPAGTSIVGTDPQATTVEGLVATWNDIGPLAPNETKHLKMTIKAPAGASLQSLFSNNTVVTADCDGTPARGGDTETLPKVGKNSGDPCTLDASDVAASHREVFNGETFTYFVRVVNHGVDSCPSVTVKLKTPPGTEFVSATDGGTYADNTVTWTIPTLGPGSSKDLGAVVRVLPDTAPGTRLPGEITATSGPSSVTASTPGPVVTANSVLADLPHADFGGRLPATGLSWIGFGWAVLGAAALAMAAVRRTALAVLTR